MEACARGLDFGRLELMVVVVHRSGWNCNILGRCLYGTCTIHSFENVNDFLEETLISRFSS